MSAYNNINPTPAAVLIAHIRRHPYLYCSLLIHALVLYLLHSHAVKISTQQIHEKNRANVEVSVQKAAHADLEKRVNDIEKIQDLIEKSTGNNSDTNKADNKSSQPVTL